MGKTMTRVDDKRREVEARLEDIRRALRSEVGFAPPRKAGWLIPLVGASMGLFLAYRFLDRRRERRALGEGSGTGSGEPG